MDSNLSYKIQMLNAKVKDLKRVSTFEKPARAQAIIEDAVFIIEKMALNQAALEDKLNQMIIDDIPFGDCVEGEHGE